MGATVTLTSQRTDRINALVADGNFGSVDEAAEQLLAEVPDPAPVYSDEELSELRKAAAEADHGEFVSPEETIAFFADWRRNG